MSRVIIGLDGLEDLARAHHPQVPVELKFPRIEAVQGGGQFETQGRTIQSGPVGQAQTDALAAPAAGAAAGKGHGLEGDPLERRRFK